MSEVSREAVLDTVLKTLIQLADDWEYSKEITPNTFFVADLGLESIDLVVLGATIQKHYNQTLPFAEFLAEIGQREVRDIRIDEFVEFVYQHLNNMQPA